MAYIIGNRKQKTFFPPMIEDYVGIEDPVSRSYAKSVAGSTILAR